MARHYSIRDFFRQVPNALLARYFHARGQFADLDFATIKESRPDKLFEAWAYLPADQRRDMDADLREIFELSCEKGFRAILDEAAFHLSCDEHSAFVEKLAALANHYERAMVTFLEHNEFWKGATNFYHADVLPYWRKRKNLPRQKAAVDSASLRRLEGMIRNYFHHTEGRGKNCVVEPYRRGDLDYYFAYPEDYSQHSTEWVNGEFERRPHNPAFEVIYVYSQKDGSLDLNFSGARGAMEPLQAIFAEAILKLATLPPDPKDERVYDLNPLKERRFEFLFSTDSGIEDAVVRKLRLSSTVKKGDRITLEANAGDSAKAIYDLLDQIGRAVPLDLYHATRVEIAAKVVVVASKPAKTVLISITHPNSCSLKYDEVDLRLRDMLHNSGIEPKEPAEAVDEADDAGA